MNRGVDSLGFLCFYTVNLQLQNMLFLVLTASQCYGHALDSELLSCRVTVKFSQSCKGNNNGCFIVIAEKTIAVQIRMSCYSSKGKLLQLSTRMDKKD